MSIAIEGVVSPKGLGGKAHASVGIRAFGRTASVGIGFSFNNGLLEQARARVAGFMALGLSTPIPDKSQTAILWGHAGGLRRSDPDFYAAQIMNLVLGGGGALNSRLGTVIRDEMGLAYTVESFFDAGWYPGPFAVSLGTNPANAKQAIAVMLREVRRLRDQGITRRERDEAVAYLTGRFPLRLETNSGMADVLWAMEFYRLGADYLDRYGDYYRAVTVEQANDAALKHLHPDRGTLVVAGTDPEAIDR